MTPYKQAFTLIELLVVVLIIGILAAVALPQYQKAVHKTRATQAVQIINGLEKATEALLLENPTAVNDNTDPNDAGLAIDIPCNYDESGECFVNTYDNVRLELGGNGSACAYTYHVYTKGQYDEYVTIAACRDTQGNWTHRCGYQADRGKAICEGLQGYEAIEGFDI